MTPKPVDQRLQAISLRWFSSTHFRVLSHLLLSTTTPSALGQALPRNTHIARLPCAAFPCASSSFDLPQGPLQASRQTGISCASPLCIFVDVSQIPPRTFLVSMALQVRPAFGHLFDFHRLVNAWQDTTNHMHWILPCVLICSTCFLVLHGISAHASNDVHTHCIEPHWLSLWQRFLCSRGRMHLKACRMVH